LVRLVSGWDLLLLCLLLLLLVLLLLLLLLLSCGLLNVVCRVMADGGCWM
jgi:hypothetical protein